MKRSVRVYIYFCVFPEERHTKMESSLEEWQTMVWPGQISLHKVSRTKPMIQKQRPPECTHLVTHHCQPYLSVPTCRVFPAFDKLRKCSSSYHVSSRLRRKQAWG